MRRLTGVALAAVLMAGPALAQKAGGAPAFRDALATAAAPFLAKGAGAGWDTGGEPSVTGSAEAGYTIAVPKLVYRSGNASADFGATTIVVKPQSGGYAVKATPARLKISDGQGVAVDAGFSKATLEGLWLPERETFGDLTFSLRGVKAVMRGDSRVAMEQLSGSFKSEAGPQANATGGFAGNIAIAKLNGEAGNGTTTRFDEVALGLNLTGMQRPSAELEIAYRHERPAAPSGLPRELIPTKLRIDTTVAPFPWRQALAQLPRLGADLAAAAGSGGMALPGALGGLGGLLASADSTLKLTRLAATTPSLNAGGTGQAKFQPDGRAVGQFTIEIKGIDERLNTMDQGEQRKHPELFPVLALMSLLGESQGKASAKVQRYRIDLKPNGSVALNGRDAASIKLPDTQR